MAAGEMVGTREAPPRMGKTLLFGSCHVDTDTFCGKWNRLCTSSNDWPPMVVAPCLVDSPWEAAHHYWTCRCGGDAGREKRDIEGATE